MYPNEHGTQHMPQYTARGGRALFAARMFFWAAITFVGAVLVWFGLHPTEPLWEKPVAISPVASVETRAASAPARVTTKATPRATHAPWVAATPVATRATAGAPVQTTVPGGYFKNCTALRRVYPLGVAAGHPAYRGPLDRDKDGWACEVTASQSSPPPSATPATTVTEEPERPVPTTIPPSQSPTVDPGTDEPVEGS